MGFQVSGVRKALAAVWRICEKGNLIQIGPDPDDNYMRNKVSGEKVMMEKKGGAYVLGVELMGRKSDLVFRGRESRG